MVLALALAFGVVLLSGPTLGTAYAECRRLPNGGYHCDGEDNPGPGDPGPGDPGPGDPGRQPHDVYYTPACMANGPPPNDPNAMCMGATAACQVQGEEGSINMRIYYQWEPNGPWELVDTRCVGPDEDPEIIITPEQVRTWLIEGWLPAANVGVSPGNGRTLVALETIFYTDSPTTYNDTRNVPGGRVTVDARATSYAWSWGDGTSDSSSTGGVRFAPGRPMSDYVTHKYTGLGSFTVDVDVTWSVTFQINGGPPQQMDIPVTRGQTAPVQVLEKEERLGER